MPNHQIQSGNNYRQNRGHQRPNRNNHRGPPKFLGETPALRGHVYEIRKGITRPWKSVDKITHEIADYFLLEFEKGYDLRQCLLQREYPELIKPTPPTTNPEEDLVGHVKWECKCEKYVEDMEQRRVNSGRAFAIILGQCSPELCTHMEFRDAWKEVNEQSDVVGLLKLIEEVMISQNTRQFEVHGYAQALRDFFAFRQGKNVSCSDYLDMFKDLVKAVLHFGGELGGERERVRNYICNELKQDFDSMTTEAYNQAVKDCREKFLAVCFLDQADPNRFDNLKISLHNTQLLRPGHSVYPKTLLKAYSMLLDYEMSSHQCQPQY